MRRSPHQLDPALRPPERHLDLPLGARHLHVDALRALVGIEQADIQRAQLTGLGAGELVAGVEVGMFILGRRLGAWLQHGRMHLGLAQGALGRGVRLLARRFVVDKVALP